MGHTGRDDESGDRTFWNESVLNPLPIPDADQRRSLHGDHLRPAGVRVVTPHAARLCDDHMHMLLIVQTLRIEWLEHAATMVPMEHDRFDPDTPRAVLDCIYGSMALCSRA
jgi:hypothetical protein